jgi:hypothetical protein
MVEKIALAAIPLLVAVTPSSALALPGDPATGSSPGADPRASELQLKDEPTAPGASELPVKRDVRGEVPITAFTYSADGAPAKSIGAQGYGMGVGASGQDTVLGGGGMVWWGPIDRLTLVLDAQRSFYEKFSPSVAATYRILGDRGDGWKLGGLGKFKVDGFSEGPDGDEVESEVEMGLLLSLAETGWHLDSNAIFGIGTGEEGEKDGEARLRFGRDLGKRVRLGLDGQARLRLDGPKYLPNGRTWDFAAGAQTVVGFQNFFGSFTVGPSTMGLTSKSVGVLAFLAVGGTT